MRLLWPKSQRGSALILGLAIVVLFIVITANRYTGRAAAATSSISTIAADDCSKSTQSSQSLNPYSKNFLVNNAQRQCELEHEIQRLNRTILSLKNKLSSNLDAQTRKDLQESIDRLMKERAEVQKNLSQVQSPRSPEAGPLERITDKIDDLSNGCIWGGIRPCLEGAAAWLISMVLQGLSLVIAAAASALSTFINFSAEALPPEVVAGWLAVKNVVNLFFILVLIAIAFGTIFDTKFKWQNTITPFLIVALLINFSLPLARYLLIVSSGLSDIFLNTIGDLSITLAKGFSLNTLSTYDATGIGALNGVGRIASMLVIGFLQISFYLIIALAFVVAAIFTLVRIPVIWFLIIFAPLAWFSYMVPQLKSSIWSKWWSEFLSWTFFVPIYLFFLMFATILINNQEAIVASSKIKDTFTGPAGDKVMAFFSVLGLGQIFFMIVVLIAVLGGLGMAFQITKSLTGGGEYFGSFTNSLKKLGPSARTIPGSALAVGAWKGAQQRVEGIKERGVFGIGGTRNARETEERMRGLVAGGFEGRNEVVRQQAATKLEEAAKSLENTTKNLTTERRNEILRSTAQGNDPKALAAKMKLLETGQLSFNDYQATLKAVGGDSSAMGLKLAAAAKKGGIKQFNLSDAELLRFLRSDDPSLRETRKLLAKDASKKLADPRRTNPSDLAKIMGNFTDPNERKEFNDAIAEVNYAQMAEADLRQRKGVGAGVALNATQEAELQRSIDDYVRNTENDKLRNQAADFFRSARVENAVRSGALDEEDFGELSSKMKGDKKRALQSLASRVGITITRTPPAGPTPPPTPTP